MPLSTNAKALLIFSHGAMINRFEAPTTDKILANELSASKLDLKPFDLNCVHNLATRSELL